VTCGTVELVRLRQTGLVTELTMRLADDALPLKVRQEYVHALESALI